MRLSTPVERGRRLARRALLFSAASAVCAFGTAQAQQAVSKTTQQSAGSEAPNQTASMSASKPAQKSSGSGGGTSSIDPGSGDPSPTPSSGGDIVPPKILTTTPGGINLADGSYNYTVIDLSIGTLSLDRYYDGPPPNQGRRVFDPDAMFFGPHTNSTFDIYVATSFVPASKDPGPSRYPQHYHAIVHTGSATSGTYWQSSLQNSTSITADDGQAEASVLSFDGGVYVYTDQSGTVYRFNPGVQVRGTPSEANIVYSQRVAQITYPDGRIRNFTYDGNGQLKLVSDSTGYAIVFDYNSVGTVAAACGFNLSHSYADVNTTCSGSSLRTSYSLSNGSLTSVTDVLGKTTVYSYGPVNTPSAGLITCVQPPGYSGCKVTNSYDNQQVDQTLVNTGKWHLVWGGTFNRESEDYVASDGDSYGNVTDPNGNTAYHNFTGSTPYDLTDENGRYYAYKFEGGGNRLEGQNQTIHIGTLLTEVDLPEGNKYLQSNTGPYHVVDEQRMRAKPNPDGSASSLPDEVTQFGFNCVNGTLTPACTKPITRLDTLGSQASSAGVAAYQAGNQAAGDAYFAQARKHETDWNYTSFGSPAWEMQPPPSDGSPRALKLYTYVQKYAWIIGAGGGLVQAATPIWLPSTETDCQTVAGFAAGQPASTPTCDASVPQVTTTYEYGPDGTADDQLLRGKVVSADGKSYRTCYGYDAASNRIAETSPRAGFATCPTDDQPNP